MNIEKHLILIKGEDKTKQVFNCNYKESKWYVTFDNNKRYEYHYLNIVWLRDPMKKDVTTHVVYKNNQPITGVNKILIFGSYIRLIFNNNYTEVYKLAEIVIKESYLNIKSATNCIDYLKQISDYISVKDERDSSFLRRQYERMTFINPNSVLAKYLGSSETYEQNKLNQIIFPFGYNISQKHATELALTQQLSVIEGPPGTGKTQTILNIIANAVINNKKVAVVSNNNSATANVIEKLAKYDLDFICAYLGNNANKDKFFKEQPEVYPNIQDWRLDLNNVYYIKQELNLLQHELDNMLEAKNRLAKVEQELSKLKIEYKYFETYLSETGLKLPKIKLLRNLTSYKILDLIMDFENSLNKIEQVSIIFKIMSFFKYGVYNFKLYLNHSENIISSLQNLFYKQRLCELELEHKQLKRKLKDYNFNNKIEKYTEDSINIFKDTLASLYGSNLNRIQFDQTVLWKDFDTFIREYPVILSTTHSLRTTIKQDYQFDYLIIDEASQVDIVTGALALSCAKKAVIVGDIKQLPNVISNNKIDSLNEIFNAYNLNNAYNITQHSLLSSILKLYKNVPKTLLREHYRCHPQIIDFCNQKFYNNELIILSENKEEDNPLTLYITAEGNHARGTYNQRQIDVIIKEILPQHNLDGQVKTIGIISPYRKHAEELQKIIGNQNIEADTVHKFQGREKGIIILSTVANEINNFVDDPNLINVAVSRAVDKLIIVVANGFEEQVGTNIGDLIRYIKYNNFEIVESHVYSAFDLLYSNYSKKLLSRFKKIKKVSEFQSENLINNVIEEVLKREEFRSLDKILHQPLRMLIKDSFKLDDNEYKFAMNHLTHTDFLIYSKVDKTPILVIEVDGYAFHEQNLVQLKRDKMKDEILSKYNIPILRLKTNESGEEEKIVSKLKGVITSINV